MNMAFNPVDFIHRLEGEGLTRGAAEVISSAIEERNRALATKDDLREIVTNTSLDEKLGRAKAELETEIARAATRQMIQFGGMITVAVAIIGVFISFK